MGERTELKTAGGEWTPWEAEGPDSRANVWTLLFEGWVVVEVLQWNGDKWQASRVHKRVPDFVLSRPPEHVSTAIRRRTDAFTPE